eukprot:CAMPEP_0196781918 /NCGR_PEP_ID=MMETSP1104-20130614/10438_1 /TAXON_ID=33652 /ORGANISM="Cafeteria sp., Strain Caron Lab Isolate" /LENGTH=300 /DNA_ID=CAMNT_0042152149 /DNA_START=48 /DNA_END=950 /DNA_ORIENTATION=-
MSEAFSASRWWMMTYNVCQWGSRGTDARHDDLAAVLKHLGEKHGDAPGIVCFQEVLGQAGLYNLRQHLMSTYGDTFESAFADMAPSQDTAILYDTRQFRRTASITVPVFDGHTRFEITATRLEHTEGNPKLTVINLHLHSGCTSSGAREAEIKSLLPFIEEEAGSGRHVIVAGTMHWPTPDDSSYVALKGAVNDAAKHEMVGTAVEWPVAMLTGSTSTHGGRGHHGGGLSRRHDAIMVSPEVLSSYGKMDYFVPGNDGNPARKGQAITFGYEEGSDAARLAASLEAVSDHLPVVVVFESA